MNLFQRKTPANHPDDVINKDNNNNDGNFICVFECIYKCWLRLDY